MTRVLLVLPLLLLTAVAHAEPPSATVTATVVERPATTILCGVLEVWTVIHLDVRGDADAPSGRDTPVHRLPVAVQCLELVQPPIAKGDRVDVTLDGPHASGRWGRTRAWIAKSIARR
jgi:hypothetical protein